jgi:hypothetical protein
LGVAPGFQEESGTTEYMYAYPYPGLLGAA